MVPGQLSWGVWFRDKVVFIDSYKKYIRLKQLCTSVESMDSRRGLKSYSTFAALRQSPSTGITYFVGAPRLCLVHSHPCDLHRRRYRETTVPVPTGCASPPTHRLVTGHRIGQSFLDVTGLAGESRWVRWLLSLDWRLD